MAIPDQQLKPTQINTVVPDIAFDFLVLCNDFQKWMTPAKHPNPSNEDNAVADWTLVSEWSQETENIRFELSESLDEVFRKLCLEVSGERDIERLELQQLIDFQKVRQDLDGKIKKLESRILSEKQFNRKVALNLELQKLQHE